MKPLHYYCCIGYEAPILILLCRLGTTSLLFYSLDSYIYKGSLIICIMEYLYIYGL